MVMTFKSCNCVITITITEWSLTIMLLQPCNCVITITIAIVITLVMPKCNYVITIILTLRTLYRQFVPVMV